MELNLRITTASGWLERLVRLGRNARNGRFNEPLPRDVPNPLESHHPTLWIERLRIGRACAVNHNVSCFIEVPATLRNGFAVQNRLPVFRVENKVVIVIVWLRVRPFVIGQYFLADYGC